MSTSRKKQEELHELRKKASELVDVGYSFREAGKMLGKSYSWVYKYYIEKDKR